MMTATPMREGKATVSDQGDDHGDDATSPPQPLSRLVGLLTNESELDARWGARRQGERIPFCKPLALTRLEIVESAVDSARDADALPVDVEQVFEGWALNICHGGLRVITEEALAIGDFLGVEVTTSGTLYTGKARVCWVRKEADGVVAGLQFAFAG